MLDHLPVGTGKTKGSLQEKLILWMVLKFFRAPIHFQMSVMGRIWSLPVNPVIMHVEILAWIQVSTSTFVNVNIQVEQKP